MNEVVTIFLLAVDKFMPDMHLKQLDFAYSACGPFAKTKERIETFLLDWKYRFYLQKWAW